MYYSRHEEEVRDKLNDEKLQKYSYLGIYNVYLRSWIFDTFEFQPHCTFFLGMAVTGGRYFDAEMAYAAGAPRSNETGQVFIFTRGTMNTNPMYEKIILSGEQFASNFGYELSTADGKEFFFIF